MKIIASTIIEGEGDRYSVTEYEEKYFSVKLLPQLGFLFSADLDWLHASGYLEDGDATYEVPAAVREQIEAWATERGWEAL